jgi:pimeloyl-ACP methyl ester carboxylesterase
MRTEHAYKNRLLPAGKAGGSVVLVGHGLGAAAAFKAAASLADDVGAVVALGARDDKAQLATKSGCGEVSPKASVLFLDVAPNYMSPQPGHGDAEAMFDALPQVSAVASDAMEEAKAQLAGGGGSSSSGDAAGAAARKAALKSWTEGGVSGKKWELRMPGGSHCHFAVQDPEVSGDSAEGPRSEGGAFRCSSVEAMCGYDNTLCDFHAPSVPEGVQQRQARALILPFVDMMMRKSSFAQWTFYDKAGLAFQRIPASYGSKPVRLKMMQKAEQI